MVTANWRHATNISRGILAIVCQVCVVNIKLQIGLMFFISNKLLTGHKNVSNIRIIFIFYCSYWLCFNTSLMSQTRMQLHTWIYLQTSKKQSLYSSICSGCDFESCGRERVDSMDLQNIIVPSDPRYQYIQYKHYR